MRPRGPPAGRALQVPGADGPAGVEPRGGRASAPGERGQVPTRCSWWLRRWGTASPAAFGIAWSGPGPQQRCRPRWMQKYGATSADAGGLPGSRCSYGCLKWTPRSAPAVDRCLGLFEDFCIVTASVRQGIPVDVQVRMEGYGSRPLQSTVVPDVGSALPGPAPPGTALSWARTRSTR